MATALERKEKKLYTAYRDTMTSTVGRTDRKIDIGLRKFAKELTTTDKPFDQLFNEFYRKAKLREGLAVTVRASLIEQTAIGYGVLPTLSVNKIEAIATPEKLVEIFGKTNGKALSKNIYSSIDNTRESIVRSLQTSHKNYVGFNKSVANVGKELEKVGLRKSNLAGYIKDLEKTGKTFIEKGDKKSKKAFDKAVANAEHQIENLSDRRGLFKTQRRVLKDTVSAVKNGNLERLEKTIDNAVKAKYKSNMQRLVVTENGTVFEQAAYNERYENPLITAVKFNLSSSHDFVDQCDVLADFDGFGLGPGVYPLKQQPLLVIHPNGVSFMTSVVRSDVSEQKADEAGKYKSSKFVKAGEEAGLSKSQLESLQNLQQQGRVRIDSEAAINAVT
jgi:hypothetical protein